MAQIEKRVRTSGVALTLNQRAADRAEATELPCGSHGVSREVQRWVRGLFDPVPSTSTRIRLRPRGTVINR